MMCSNCTVDQPRDQFGPSAEQWSRHRMCRTCNRLRSQRKRHGLTQDERAQIAAAQGGCAICGHPEPSTKGWVVDHDRSCCDKDASCPKCRRGVICQWCNSVIGYAFDRVETLRRAIAYLEAPRTCSWHMPIACAPSICDADMHGRNGRDGLTQNPTSDAAIVQSPTRAGGRGK